MQSTPKVLVSYADAEGTVEREVEAVLLVDTDLLVVERGHAEAYLSYHPQIGRWYRDGDWAAAVSLRVLSLSSSDDALDVAAGEYVLHVSDSLFLPQAKDGGPTRLMVNSGGEGHPVAELTSEGWQGIGWRAKGTLEVRPGRTRFRAEPRSRLSLLSR